MKSILIKAGLVISVVFALIVITMGMYTVDSGYRGIIKTWGKVTSVTTDGLHFKVPIMQTVTKVDVRTKKSTSSANAGTKDMQNASTEVTANYHLEQGKLDRIYSEFGLDVEDKIISPRIQEVVKAVVAKYSAEDLLKKREYVKGDIETNLRTALGAYDIYLEGIAITNFEFSQAFNTAIENKQIAEQNALKARNDLERVKIEAEQKITVAQAEAQSIKIQSEAIKAQGGAEYVKLKAIEKWNGGLPTYVGGNGAVPFLNVQ